MEIAEVQLSGLVTYEAASAALPQLWAEPVRARHRWLITLQDCDNQLMATDVERLATMLVDAAKSNNIDEIRAAILVDSAVDLGLMHMLSAYCALGGLEVVVLNGDRQQAVAQLVA